MGKAVIHRRFLMLGTVLSAALLAGCGPIATAPVAGATAAGDPASMPQARTPAPSAGDLTFSYHRHGSGDETIDQTLHIDNAFKQSVVPVLALTALDAHGDVLPQVKVSTVYGSDHGALDVPYGEGMDILRFSGVGEHQVADVRVAVRSVTAAQTRAGGYDPAQTLDAHGRAVSRFSGFSAVSVTNPDAYAVTVRVVYLVYDQPVDNQTQQAVVVVPIGGLVTLPAHGKATVEVSGAAASAVRKYSNGPAVSVKTYPSQ